jgi:DNA-binding NtrC family response regulator
MQGTETILVVEDAEDIRRLVCGVLTLQGYRCLTAQDGIDALQVIETGSEPPQLVLTDVVMPRMKGNELAQHIAKTRPEIRIVLMSGFAADPLVRTFERTPSIFLAKPFTADALCVKVRQALDRPWAGLPALDSEPERK